jgi:hypothetical protein
MVPQMCDRVLPPLLIYNCICSYLVGKRFNDDPRLTAQLWMIKNVPHGSIIESSSSSPHRSKLPNFDAREVNLGLHHRRGASEGETTDLRLPHVSSSSGKIEPRSPEITALSAKLGRRGAAELSELYEPCGFLIKPK